MTWYRTQSSCVATFKRDFQKLRKNLQLRGFGPRVNYTYRAMPLVGEVSASYFRIEGVAWSAQRIPTVVNYESKTRLQSLIT
jgi:hypothetical protein